ncbi:MAG: DNA polymerase I [Candidatus Binatia bacterium]
MAAPRFRMSNPVLYLVDASSYVYRAFFALPPLSSPSGLPTNAVYGFTTMLVKLLRDLEPQYIGAVFDAPGPTFRDDLFAPYKANRPAMPDDLAAQFPLVHETVAAFALHALSIPGVEADDVIGTVATRMAGQGVEVVIITGDKDLMQLVDDHVRLWDTMRDRWTDADAVRQRYGVTPEQMVDIIGLMGDSVDNIPGVKGIGEKTATALIQRFGSIEHLLQQLDALEAATDVRGAKKLAATLRANAETARLSRALAVIRRDVPVACDLESFHYHGPNSDALRALCTRLGFQSLVKEVAASVPAATVPCRRAESGAEVQAIESAARRTGRVAMACDGRLERDGPHTTGVVIVAEGEMPLYVPLADATLSTPLAELLTDERIEKVGHDLKRDLLLIGDRLDRPLAPAFDVMLASYLLEASATHRLEDLATDAGVSLPVFRDGPDTLANGVSMLGGWRERFASRLHECAMDHLFYDVEMPLVAVLAAMERRGVRLDVGALAVMSAEMDVRLNALMQEIHALAGGEFNIASPPQLREVLFERLGLSRKGVKRGKTGLSTDVDVLTRLAAEHPLPAKILEYRMLSKLKSTYVDALPAAVNPLTGRLHTTFNQTVAATGRLSSSDPNLQNIPVRGEEGRRIRAAFIADGGCALISADYSQIELRVLAHLSGDPVLVAAFHAGDDIHARTAAEVFGVLPGAITAEMRRAAKVINFGIIYGMGAQRLARELSISLPEAERYIASYFERYAGVRAFFQATQAEARTRGYVTTLLGRRRSLPDLTSAHRGVAQAAERTAINTPIQGSAADLIKLAMVAIDRRLTREAVRASMILQVHDELVFEAAAADCERAATVIREEMEGVLALKVPLRVDLQVGHNWAEVH